MTMDPLFLALSLFRRRKFEESSALCTELLKKNPFDQVNYTTVGGREVSTIVAMIILWLYT